MGQFEKIVHGLYIGYWYFVNVNFPELGNYSVVLVNYFEEKKEKEKDIEVFWDKRMYVQELFSKVCLKKKKKRVNLYREWDDEVKEGKY